MCTSTQQTIVELSGLVRLASDRRTPLLDDIHLRVDAGEQLVIRGPSGSGKTLLLRSLAALDPLDEGLLRWRGEPLSDASVPDFRGRVIYLGQRPALYEGTVEDNLRLPFRFKVHGNRQFAGENVRGQLEELGRSGDFLRQDARQLSGGEGQIVALLRAIQLRPDVLLLDEPTASLDAATTTSIERLVAMWMKDGAGQRALVWVSHQADQIDRVATRVLDMHQGRLTQGRQVAGESRQHG